MGRDGHIDPFHVKTFVEVWKFYSIWNLYTPCGRFQWISLLGIAIWNLHIRCATRPNSSDPLHNVGLILPSTAVATASWSTLDSTMRVLWCYCNSSYRACSSCRVPSTVLRIAVATEVLRYVRPTELVRRNLDVYIVIKSITEGWGFQWECRVG